MDAMDDQDQDNEDQDGELPQGQEQGEVAGNSGVPDPMSLPAHGTEIFVSKIPREATDEQLLAFCEQFGHKIHSIRLSKDPGNPGQNKGYAFAIYQEVIGANQTLQKLNQAELPDFPGRKVTIVRSELNNKLFIGNIPREMSKEQVLDILKADVVGVMDMRLIMDRAGPGGDASASVSKGFGFVEFFNKAAAEAARKKLSSPDYRIRGNALQVRWAEAKKENVNLELVKSIYVGNLPQGGSDEHKLRDIFSAYGKISHVVLLKDPSDSAKFRDYCFVHFEERSAAVRAVDEAADGPKPMMDGNELKVHMARPQPRDEVHEGGTRSGGSFGRGPGYVQGGGRGYSGGAAGGRGGGGGYEGAAPRGGSYGGPGRGGAYGGASMRRPSQDDTAPPPPAGYGPRSGGSYGPGGGAGGGGGARGVGAPSPRTAGGRVAPAPVHHGYDDGYIDDGYGAEEDFAGDEYDGYGSYGFPTAGMTMVPMMMPGGQVAYVMAAAPSASAVNPTVQMLPRGQPPPPTDPPPGTGSGGGPVRRNSAPSPRDYGGGGSDYPPARGAPASYGSAAARGGGGYGPASSGGYSGRGAAYGAAGGASRAPEGYVSRGSAAPGGGAYGGGGRSGGHYEEEYVGGGARGDVYAEVPRGVYGGAQRGAGLERALPTQSAYGGGRGSAGRGGGHPPQRYTPY